MNQDFKDMFKILNEHRAKYLIVGAYAVTYHAEPRYTKDLDIWVEPTLENAKKIWQALTVFNAPLDGVHVEDFCNKDLVYQIGVEPNRIDVMMDVPGVEFTEAWANRVESSYCGEKVNIIAINDLIVSKRTANRDQDKIDVRNLEKAKSQAQQ
jgi:hypothetical protein